MIEYQPIIQSIQNDLLPSLDILRLDLLDPEISGNKWFKLKKNLDAALSHNHTTLITFGGAFSNHLAATAAACKRYGLNSVGIIRGEKPAILNPTLKKAEQDGMKLHFVTRERYAEKETDPFKTFLHQTFGPHHLIPEGGNNAEGILGCSDILKAEWEYDLIFCACGTAATYTGLFLGKKRHTRLVGISVLKGENTLPSDVKRNLPDHFSDAAIAGNEALEKGVINESCILNTYAFKGYASCEHHLLEFKTRFESEHKIPLDHVYTTKLFYAVSDLTKNKKLEPGAKVLVIHSGGLQGNEGFEERYHLTPNR